MMAVLTDVDLIRLLKDGRTTIELVPKTVITPSAMERIRAKGIEIVYQGDAPAKRPERPWEKITVSSSSQQPDAHKYRCYQTGGYFSEKPEHMTAIRGNELVFKNHPRIVFRGKIDSFNARLLLLMNEWYLDDKTSLLSDMDSIKVFMYHLQLSEVGETPLEPLYLVGLSDAELREHSHHPKKYYGVEHLFQTDYTTSRDALSINTLRTQSRELEIAAFDAYFDGVNHEREDIARALNRLSSALYIIELKIVAGAYQ